MDVFAVGLKMKAEGAAAAKSIVDGLRQSIKGLKKDADETGKTSGISFKRMASGLIAAAGGAALLAAGFKKVVDESIAAQDAEAQLVATLESTNYAAGQTKESLQAMAAEIQKTTRFGDDAVIAMQSVLLTFTKIGGDTFPKATRAIADMSAKLGGDLKSTALQVGKALNDPVRGVSMLNRVGVQFTETEKELVKTLAETGKHAEAQAIVLKKLETQFGGSAAAARNTLGGALEALSNQWGDLFEVSKENSAGIIAAIEGLTAFLPKIRDTINDTLQGWRFIWVDMQITTTLAIEKIKLGIDTVVTAFKNMGRILTLQEPIVSKAGEEYDALKENLEKWREEQYKLIVGIDKSIPPTKNFTKAVSTLGRSELPTLNKAFSQIKETLRLWREEIASSKNQEAAEKLKRLVTGSGVQSLPTSLKPTPIKDLVQPLTTEARSQMEESLRMAGLKETFAESVSDSIVEGFSAGVAEAVATGRIGEGFKALTSTLLGGLGRAMIEFGAASLKVSVLMEKIKASLASFLPGGAVVASIAMIALGSALAGVAGAAFGGGRGAGAVGVGSAGQPSIPGISQGGATQLIFGNTSASTAAGMTPRAANNFVIIGPDDPTAQRAISELIRNADRRGSIG